MIRGDIESDQSNYLDQECVICFEPLGSVNIWKCKQCSVMIHKKCISNQINKTCPCCRFKITVPPPEIQTYTPIMVTNIQICLYKFLILFGIYSMCVCSTVGCIYFFLPSFFTGVRPYNGTILKY